METNTDIVIACCRDEEDIIEAFIDFYLWTGFDKICLIDNGSIDNTVNLIKAHPKQAQITLLEDARIGHDSRLKEYFDMFSQYATRWVFFIDIDEIIHFENGAKEYFAELEPKINCLRFLIKDMYHDIENQRPYSHPFLSTNLEPLFHDTVKEVSKSLALDWMSAGRHELKFMDKHVFCPQDVFIRHYNLRSPSQVKTKLKNRYQYERGFTEEQKQQISAFSSEVQLYWLKETRNMIKNEYWNHFVKEYPVYEYDDVIRNWFDLYYQLS